MEGFDADGTKGVPWGRTNKGFQS